MRQARIPVYNVRHDHAVPVTMAAYTQLTAALGADIKELEIFDSSGKVLQLAIGPAGFESDLPFMILPGGNAPSRVGCLLNRGMRISVKAVDADTAIGQLIINGYA